MPLRNDLKVYTTFPDLSTEKSKPPFFARRPARRGAGRGGAIPRRRARAFAREWRKDRHSCGPVRGCARRTGISPVHSVAEASSATSGTGGLTGVCLSRGFMFIIASLMLSGAVCAAKAADYAPGCYFLLTFDGIRRIMVATLLRIPKERCALKHKEPAGRSGYYPHGHYAGSPNRRQKKTVRKPLFYVADRACACVFVVSPCC